MDENEVVYFAKTNFRNKDTAFGIRQEDRRQHMYVVGKTGTGKTNLIKNLAIQDIKTGKGLVVVDPHGEFVESLLDFIPEERKEDVVYFNPADTDYPIGFNVLEIPDPQYKHLIASGLMGIFTKIWAGVWSARMEYILSNCVLALLDTPGATLLGIQRMLVDNAYRAYVVNNIQDPVVKSFWVNEYENYTERLRSEAIAPIQNKVGQFLSSALIRNIVGQPKSTLKISEIMDQGKILLVNVSKGRVGEDNSALLGAMIITKIQLEAMERVRIPENERRDFYLYVDEFQNFATDSFASILSESRKYRLNLIIAHQYIGQLVTDISTKVRDAVFGNVGTMILFRIGAADAEFMEKEFMPHFNLNDLVNLPNFEIYLKLMIDGVSSRPFSAKTLPPIVAMETPKVAKSVIVDASRKKYSRNVLLVEEQISRTMTEEYGYHAQKLSANNNEWQNNPRKLNNSGNNNQGAPRFQNQAPVNPVPQLSPSEKVFPDFLGVLGIEFPNKDKSEAVQNNTNPHRSIQAQTPSIVAADPAHSTATSQSHNYDPANQEQREQYQSQCWVCKKPTILPFPPDGINPIYCKACLRGIKMGTIEPLPPKDIPKKPIPKWKEEETRHKIAESEARKSKTLQEALQKGTARMINTGPKKKELKSSTEEDLKKAIEEALEKI